MQSGTFAFLRISISCPIGSDCSQELRTLLNMAFSPHPIPIVAFLTIRASILD